MPYDTKEHKQCRNCKFQELDALGGESWHCSLDLSMLGDEKMFIKDLMEKCKRFRVKFEKNYNEKLSHGDVEKYYGDL